MANSAHNHVAVSVGLRRFSGLTQRFAARLKAGSAVWIGAVARVVDVESDFDVWHLKEKGGAAFELLLTAPIFELIQFILRANLHTPA